MGRHFCSGCVRETSARQEQKVANPGADDSRSFAVARSTGNRVGKIRLPRTLLFEDYSSIAADGDRLAVVSQVNSALWVGNLAPSSWDIVDEGITYTFPLTAVGQVIYCNIEGISWTESNRIVVVSDKAKSKQEELVREKDQSIHIFEIPGRS